MSDSEREFIEALPVPQNLAKMTDEEIDAWVAKRLGVAPDTDEED